MSKDTHTPFQHQKVFPDAINLKREQWSEPLGWNVSAKMIRLKDGGETALRVT
ncbi:hypothetical protein B9G69_002795 [Bdellovibrio sp. SKB1291214]|uniref:hypothetical protein n=1 Tax=Bdellovibrio sp. SKB1291214 TaxID=1732569 RepID=UPI0020CF6218|nr:hypothetical protein [Bdellovibrio sp. SKB1291214]UYL09500.1 hypothetical protein B9G69_002795 [Bdellovibrio sp. SKB1291214]